VAQLIIRFLVGGAVVSLFAVLADVLKPKSFAGLFGAAPSVALATLGLTILANGKPYAALEARSMVLGAFSFLVYACFCKTVIKKFNLRASVSTISGLLVWFAFSFGSWFIFLK
jgi:uncharacterized membrane protein (GlpM family)